MLRCSHIGEGQFDDEARAGWFVLLHTDGPLMFLHDFRRDGETEAGAALLGGEVWQK